MSGIDVLMLKIRSDGGAPSPGHVPLRRRSPLRKRLGPLPVGCCWRASRYRPQPPDFSDNLRKPRSPSSIPDVRSRPAGPHRSRVPRHVPDVRYHRLRDASGIRHFQLLIRCCCSTRSRFSSQNRINIPKYTFEYIID